MLSILDENNIPREKLITFNFAVLNHSSQRALQLARVKDYHSISSNIHCDTHKSRSEAILEIKDWMDRLPFQ